MARIRTVKPEFWSDERVMELSPVARLLFIGIWNFCDDRGNIDRSAKQIKARIFPADNIDTEPLLQEILTQELMIEYTAEGRRYIHVVNFRKHQCINKPSKPNCPPLPVDDDTDPENTGILPEDDGSTTTPLPDGREGKGREGKGIGKDLKSTPTEPDPEKPVTRMNLKTFSKHYTATFGTIMPGMLNQEAQETVNRHPAERIVEAFRLAAEANAKTFSYVKKVLEGGPRTATGRLGKSFARDVFGGGNQ